MSRCPQYRLYQHEWQPWWSEVAKHTLQWLPSEKAAHTVEVRAIKTEDPVYNRLGKPGEDLERTVVYFPPEMRAEIQRRRGAAILAGENVTTTEMVRRLIVKGLEAKR